VVDDGSPDDTFEVARTFESEQVRVVTQRNQGGSAARNTAFRLSRGDYIQWLDADDLLSPHKITRQMEVACASRTPLTLLSSGYGHFISQPLSATFVPTPLWTDLPSAEWLILKMGQNLHMQTGTWLVSRELTEKAGPWDTRLVTDDDGEYFCRVLLASNGVKFVTERGVYYRMPGTDNVSYIGLSPKKAEAQFLSMTLHIDYLRSIDDSPRARAACLQYLRTWAIHFIPARMDIFHKMQSLAASLGGKLEMPQLSWKYTWIRAFFGWAAARRVQVAAPALKWKLVRAIEERKARREGPVVVESLP
jgi:glycosyltransferase involved in cell wall biosynthesis